MTTLLDSNIVIYLLDRGAPEHDAVASVLSIDTNQLCLSTQNITESCHVLTRRYGLKLSQVQEGIMRLIEEYAMEVITPTSETLGIWQKLTTTHPGPVFDSFLIATMMTHGVTELVTQNTKDFRIYTPDIILHDWTLPITAESKKSAKRSTQ
ncbi:MAG: PIN domain-containing protein [Candidatus Roizmanbacteria bacterium]